MPLPAAWPFPVDSTSSKSPPTTSAQRMSWGTVRLPIFPFPGVAVKVQVDRRLSPEKAHSAAISMSDPATTTPGSVAGQSPSHCVCPPAVHRLAEPCSLSAQINSGQHVWLPSQGCPSPRHAGLALARNPVTTTAAPPAATRARSPMTRRRGKPLASIRAASSSRRALIASLPLLTTRAR